MEFYHSGSKVDTAGVTAGAPPCTLSPNNGGCDAQPRLIDGDDTNKWEDFLPTIIDFDYATSRGFPAERSGAVFDFHGATAVD
eukprot:gene18290-5605_t